MHTPTSFLPRVLLSALVLAAPLAAQAANVTVDFETATSFSSVLTHYAGGADAAGVTGTDLGVSFSGDVIALANDSLGTYFSNAPTAVGVMTVVGSDAVMDVAQGFTGSVDFAWSSLADVSGGVQVWSGAGATGTLLASFDLSTNAQAGGCSDSALCHFDAASLAFAGTAYSVSFANAANVAAFDDIAITAVPEPATAATLLAGMLMLGALAHARRGRR